jgi:LysR family transcriptional regulator of beta-lactamase
MTRRYIPLKSLRAFEAAARHLSFTHAAIELNVTHSAVSQQVKLLEDQLSCPLFLRVPRGLVLTPEGEHLLPALNESFDRIAQLLDYFTGRKVQEKLKIGVIGTFATGFLLPRLSAFYQKFPHIELQISTNNNRVDVAAEGLDYAIRFGSGAWHGTAALYLCDSPLTVLCAPDIASQLKQPSDLLNFTLLRSYRRDEWTAWLQQAGGPQLPPTHPVIVFDSSVTMLEAAQAGVGVAIAPARMFSRLITSGQIQRPFTSEISLGSYWLTRLQSRVETSAMREFAQWLSAELVASVELVVNTELQVNTALVTSSSP